MTASQKPKTPSMTMKVRPGVLPEDIELFCKRASRITLSQVVDNVIVKEEPKLEGNARSTVFTVELSFFLKKEYEAEYDVEPSEILATFGSKFPLIMRKEIQSEMKKLDADLRSQIAELGKGKKESMREGGEDEDEDGEDMDKTSKKRKEADEDSEVGDGDADDEKHARQRKQQATYDSDDENLEAEDTAYNDDAIEAAHASDVEAMDVVGSDLKKPIKDSFKTKVNLISDLFHRNLTPATSFAFTDSKCTFQLQVWFTFSVSHVKDELIDLSSSHLKCLNFFSLVLLKEHAVRLLFVRYLVSPNVSKSRMTVKKEVILRSR